MTHNTRTPPPGIFRRGCFCAQKAALRKGVDFVMTAMFVVIFLNQWEKEKQYVSALIGLLVQLVFV